MDITQKDYKYIKGVAAKFSRYDDDIEDIAQISAMKCFKGIFNGDSKRSTFIYTVVKRTAFNYYRSKRKTYDISIAPEPSYTTSYEDKVCFESLVNKIDALPKKQKECFYLRFEGHKFKDIGKKLGLTRETAAYRYKTAVESLKKELTYSGIYGTIKTG